jgi:hypothetical protein
MAHFFKPPGSPPDCYDVDGRLAPDSVWRLRIPLPASRQIALWGGRNLWVRSTNTAILPEDGFKRSDVGELTFLTLSPSGPGDCRLEAGLGASTWVTLEIQAGAAPVAAGDDFNAATQRGTYQNIDAAAVVRHFHSGRSGIELLGGLSRGYMRWLEVVGAGARESSGPTPGQKPVKASLPWRTYAERPKLVVVRQGWTFPGAGGAARHYMLEIWWVPADDTEYQVIVGHAGRAEHGDQIAYGALMRPFCGDLFLFELMKRELAAAIAHEAITLVVEAASWRLSAARGGGSDPDRGGDDEPPSDGTSGGPKQLPRISQTTQEQIAGLIAEHPGLSRANAERALRGPPGSTATLSGNKPTIPNAERAADIAFRQLTPNGNVVLRREVKVLDGDFNSFKDSVSGGAKQIMADGSGGELLVQVPPGTDARSFVQRFKGGGGLPRDAQAERLGWYRSIKITIVEPSGVVLLDEPLELPPLRTP